MEAFIIYMAKTSGLIALFYIAYYLLLKKETFFNPNRWFLIAGLVTSAVLPLVAFTKIVWIDPAPMVALSAADVQMLTQYAAAPAPQQPKITFTDVALGLYCAGMLLFLAHFLTDISIIRELIKGKKIVKQGRYKLIDSAGVQSPFSFFNYIVYNSATLQPQELESILAHEKVHSAQRHSVDMILGQLFCIAFWFNPFIWLYKKAIAQNLEFIADAGATNQVQDIIAYQKTLLKITMQPACIAITNHFYQSLIKKRIIMLNKEKSNMARSWKYAVVLPALAAFMLVYQVNVIAQEKPQTIEAQQENGLIVVQEITKDSKDSELEKDKQLFKQEFNADVAFSNITRNKKEEIMGIEVKVTVKDTEKVYRVAGSTPIESFKIVIERNEAGTSTITMGTSATIARNIAPGAAPVLTAYTDTITQSTMHIAALKPNAPMAIAGTNGNSGNVTLNMGNSDALIVINGVKCAKGQQITLPGGHQITAVTTLDNKEGKSKYGKEGKKGVIEITSAYAKTPALQTRVNMPVNVSYGYGMPDVVTDIDLSLGDIPSIKAFTDIDFDNMAIMDQMGLWDNLTGAEMADLKERLKKSQEELKKAWKGKEISAYTIDKAGWEHAAQAMAKARIEMGSAQNTSRIHLFELKKAEMESKKAELAGKKAEIEGRKAEAEGKKAAAAGKLAEIDGRKAEAEGKKAAAAGKLADKEGRKAEAEGKKAAAAGKKAEIESRKAEADGKKAAAAGKKAEMEAKKKYEAKTINI
jgi:beta-lactamase regulating signal transducer with metallopeptidase domain